MITTSVFNRWNSFPTGGPLGGGGDIGVGIGCIAYIQTSFLHFGQRNSARWFYLLRDEQRTNTIFKRAVSPTTIEVIKWQMKLEYKHQYK